LRGPAHPRSTRGSPVPWSSPSVDSRPSVSGAASPAAARLTRSWSAAHLTILGGARDGHIPRKRDSGSDFGCLALGAPELRVAFPMRELLLSEGCHPRVRLRPGCDGAGTQEHRASG